MRVLNKIKSKNSRRAHNNNSIQRSYSGNTLETQKQVFQSLADPDDKFEFTLSFVDGAWPTGPNEKGAYIVANEEINSEARKVIYEVGFVDSIVLDATTGEQNLVPTMDFKKVALLDPAEFSKVV